MKFGILTQYYPPETGAPQARLSDLAKRFVERGHEVFVLTAMPNYPQGRIYPGYGGWLRREVEDGVYLIRTGIIPSRRVEFLSRLVHHLSFVMSSLAIGGMFLPALDYLLTESPPLFLGIAGYALSRWKRARWIFNVADLWPESAVRLGYLRQGTMLDLATQLEHFCYRKAWLVTGQSKSIVDNIQRRFPGAPTYLLSNGADLSRFSPRENNGVTHEAIRGQGEVILLYAGLHGVAQGLDQLLLAAQFFREDHRLKFVFIGDGPRKAHLKQRARELNLTNVLFLDPLPREQMPSVIGTANICLVPLTSFIPGAVPSKLYEAMACEKPVVLIADGEAAEIVNAHGSGLVVSPGDFKGLVDALAYLVQRPDLWKTMGAAGRMTVEKYFDRKKIIEKFEEYLVEAL